MCRCPHNCSHRQYYYDRCNCEHYHQWPYWCGPVQPWHWQVLQPILPIAPTVPPVEKKIDRILELAERAEKRAKLNKKKSDRW